MCPSGGYFDIPFAENGDLNPIPDPTQPGGTVSYNQGFPVGYSTPVASGGLLVPRTAFNQVLNDITTAIQAIQQTGVPPYFAYISSNGGYVKYARVLYSDGHVYQSLKNSNVATPANDGVNWTLFDASAQRIKLTGDITYYVATTGNDSNPGTSGSPWLTIQHAIDYLTQNIDLAGFTATVSVADGTYSGTVVISHPFTGSGTVLLRGNTVTPANCIISTSTFCISVLNGTLNIGGFKLVSGAGTSLSLASGTRAIIAASMDFGAASGGGSGHIYCAQGSTLNIQSGYNITGSASFHILCEVGGQVFNSGSNAFAVSGTPAFSTAFASTSTCGNISMVGATYTGIATGQRYICALNGVINTNSGGANFFPGNAPGSTATGGQYV